MAFLIRPVSVLALSVLLLAACEKKPVEPSKLAALARPLQSISAQAGQVLVPQALLVERGGIPGVLVLIEDQARFRMVRSGKQVGGRVEILSGLRGDETLIAGDLRDVRDGSPIQIGRAHV